MSTDSFDSAKFKDGQRQHWDSVASGWEKWWQTLEKFSRIVTESLIQMAEVTPGQKVLDFATGIGEPALSVAKVVGDDGIVIAVDVSSEMLSIAQKRATDLDITNVEFQEADAENMNFSEGEFDSIVSRWGLMFLPNVDSTLKSIYQMLVPKGKFATAVWDKPENIPFFSFAAQTLRGMFDLPMPPPEAPTLSGLSEGVLEDKMVNAGFRDIQTELNTVNFEFSSAGEYAQLMKDIAAPLKVMLANQSPEEVSEFWKILEDSAAKDYGTSNGGVLLPGISISVVGQRE